MTTLHKFKNLFDLLKYFKDESTCRDYLEQIRWNGQVICQYKDCGHNHVHKCATRYKCAKCKRMFSVRANTIFEDSHIPLQKWFAAIYLITSHKKGISSHQLHRDIGVTQKTAWFLNHRVRNSMGLTSTEQLSGTIEADETFIGGSEKNKHAHKRTDNNQGRSVKTKTPVAGVVQRGGELRAKKIANTNGYNLRPFVKENVAFGSTVNTDEWGGYNGLAQLFHHKRINHLTGEYVNGETHTNTMESFWALLKRGVYGIYHHVSDKHLQRYVDEFVFRYNSREFSEDTRFDMLLNNLLNPLTYKQLITNGVTSANSQVEPEQGKLSL